METIQNKTILISGASIAGLTAAYWMNKIGYKVTVVELASAPRTTGAAIDIRGAVTDTVKRMEFFEEFKANGLHVEKIEFKNADDVTEGCMLLNHEADEHAGEEIEIERDKFIGIIFNSLKKDVTFMFNNSLIGLSETTDDITATFKDGTQQNFDLVLGCDGSHSGVRKLWFGPETNYAYFLEAYFSISIVNKLLVEQGTMQVYNSPDRVIMLNAYNNKTDIIFCFLAEKEIPYNYRDQEQQLKIISDAFAGESWRASELLDEIKASGNFYFDKFCQIKMPSWTKGRVALVGDAAYCASPAAGMGGSLAIEGAVTLADALQKHGGNLEQAFLDYNKNLRPLIDEVQAIAEVNVKQNFIIRTEEAIRKRNAEAKLF